MEVDNEVGHDVLDVDGTEDTQNLAKSYMDIINEGAYTFQT